jgi:hypothetical protein
MHGLLKGDWPPEVRRVYQYHVRKSAGTSLLFAFYALGGEDPKAVEARLPRYHFTTSGGYTFVAHDKRLIARGHYTFGSSHLPAWDLQLPTGTFTVTVLRDPVERALSLYRYLRDGGSDADYVFKAPPSQRRWADDGFGTFLDRVPPFHLCNQVHMFSRIGSVDEAADYISGLSFVLRTERLGEDLEQLGQTLRLPLGARTERTSTRSELLSAAEYERLREALEPEYQLLERLEIV